MDTLNSIDISRTAASKIFWSFVVFHVLIWTVLPTFIQLNPGNIDVSEMVATAREWPMGTTKHPAAPFWFFEALYQITGRAEFSLYLIGQLWTALGLWAVWRLSREIVSEKFALISVFCTAAFRYYNMGVISYTTSVPPIALWAAATTLFYLSLKYNKLRYWIGTGVFLGLGVLSKYSVFTLVLTMVLYLSLSKRNRQYWFTSGPYVTTMIAFLLFLPHAIWSCYHGCPTITYGVGSITHQILPMDRIVRPLIWLFKDIIIVIPVLIGLIPLVGFLWQPRLKAEIWQKVRSSELRVASCEKKLDEVGDVCLCKKKGSGLGTSDSTEKLAKFSCNSQLVTRNSIKDNWTFLSFIIFFPIVFQMAIGAIGGGYLRPAYGSPLWSFIALYFLCGFKVNESNKAYKTVVGLSFVVLFCTVLCFVLNYHLYYWHQQHFNQEICGSRIHYPGHGLAELVSKTWAENGSGGKCPYITGDWLPACHAAMYMADRPCTLIYYNGTDIGLEPTGYWAFDSDVNEKGGVVIWNIPKDQDDYYIPDWLYKRYPTAQPCPQAVSLPYQTKADVPPLRVRCAVIKTP